MRISDWSSDVCSSDLPEALTAMMQVNHHAPVMLSKSLVSHAKYGQCPAIVNIVDQRVAHPVPDQIAYSLSKAVLWQATATMAVAIGNRERVNAVGSEGSATCRDSEGQ